MKDKPRRGSERARGREMGLHDACSPAAVLLRRFAAAALALTSFGCAAPPPVAVDLPPAVVIPGPAVVDLPPATEMRPAADSPSAPFGGDHPGRSYWLSDNGRYALIYQWREDTNGDGTISIDIGHHGEMREDQPQPYLVETRTGEIRQYDEFLRAAAGRWIALRESGTVWLLDAETGQRSDLNSGELAADDRNECLNPREVTFDRAGDRVGLISDESGTLIVHHLNGGPTQEIDAPEGILWRAALTAIPEITLLHVVPPDSVDPERIFPQQKTSCSSRLGTLFATSYSFQGWTGAVETVVVSGSGARLRLPDPPIVLSGEVVVVGDSLLLTLDGRRVDLPLDCSGFRAAPEARSVLLQCTGEQRLFDPATRRAIPLPFHVELLRGAAGVEDDAGDVWLPVLVTDSAGSGEGAKRLARLRVADGRLEIGPAGASNATLPRHGWAMSTEAGSLDLLEIASGRVFSISDGVDVRYHSFPKLQLATGETLLLDPAGGRYLKLSEPGVANARGCALMSTGPRGTGRQYGIEQGPWRLRCATDLSAEPR